MSPPKFFQTNQQNMGNCDHRKPPTCFLCLKILSWIPVVFISTVICWSYYAYVVQLCFYSIENTFERVIFLVFYHIICVLFFWSYAQTIFTPVATVPLNWRIPDNDIERVFRCENQDTQRRMLEQLAKDFPLTNRTINGTIRFCEKCKVIKPDRAHHCSVCRACVLKMDHHCPWVNNCVNFKNYKFFVLFLGYALLYCIYVAVTSLEYFINFWRVSNGDLNTGSGRFHILFLFFVSLMFAISLVSLFGYHIYLVLMNRTTLEAFRAPVFRIGGPDKNGFNLGKYANFQEVFGDNWKLWLLPVYTSRGDGVLYPTQSPIHHATYDSMGDTPAANLDDLSSQKLFNSTNLTPPGATDSLNENFTAFNQKHNTNGTCGESSPADLHNDVIITIENAFSLDISSRTQPMAQNRIHPQMLQDKPDSTNSDEHGLP